MAAAERTNLTEVTYRNDTGGTRNFQMDILLGGIEKTGEAEDGFVDFSGVEI